MLGSCGRGCLILLLMAMAAAALVGCESRPGEPALPPGPGELPAIVLETPEDAARSVLTYLQADLQAVARRDRQAERECFEKLRAVASVTTIERSFAGLPQFKAVIGDDLVDGYLSNWGATVAYYAEGFHFDRMRRASQTPSKVAVVVPASGLDDDALIQVTCVREDDNQWRVSRIEFVVESPTARSVSQPASQPS